MGEKEKVALGRNLALDAALAVQQAYARASTSPSEIYIVDSGTDTQALVISAREEVIVAVPGTASLRDWGTNRRIFPRRVKANGRKLAGCWHRGYARAALSIVDPIQAVIEPRDDRRLVLAGHSLGGAVAGILGAILAERGALVRGYDLLYTFGAPRFAGWKASKEQGEWWEEFAERWVYETEVVPYLIPPFGYRHYGELNWVSSSGDIRSRAGLGFFRETWAALKTPGLDLLRDHGLVQTIAWMRRMMT